MSMTVYEELAARLHAPESKIIPKVLAILADETDAQILLALPANSVALAEKFPLSPENIEARLHELYHRGVVFPSPKTTPPTYRMGKEAMHLHDTTIQWKEAPMELLDLWQEWGETEYVELSFKQDKELAGGKPSTRIIAANVWLHPNSQIMPFDSIKEIITNAKSLAVLPCTCRRKARKCNHLLEACIVLNKSADYNIQRGTGRKIDVEEALEIFRKCEKEGLVHFTGGNAQDDPGPLICNCCPCCCILIPTIKRGLKLHDPSRFTARIDGELCTGCGICRDRCHFEAITWETEEENTCTVVAEKCMGCGLCESACPVAAITMIETRDTDFIPKTNRTNIYG